MQAVNDTADAEGAVPDVQEYTHISWGPGDWDDVILSTYHRFIVALWHSYTRTICLNQCWVIFNWTFRNKLKWNLNLNTITCYFSSTKMHFIRRLQNDGHFIQGQMGGFMYQMWTLQSNARVKYRISLSIMTLTVLVVKYVEDPGPAIMSDDVDNGLCVKRSHVKHVTVFLSGNIDGHAGRNVGYVKLVRVWTNGVDGAHVVRSKQNESTTRYLGTHWSKTRKLCIALGARLILILDLFRSISHINSKITLKMWSLPNKWGLKANHLSSK